MRTKRVRVITASRYPFGCTGRGRSNGSSFEGYPGKTPKIRREVVLLFSRNMVGGGVDVGGLMRITYAGPTGMCKVCPGGKVVRPKTSKSLIVVSTSTGRALARRVVRKTISCASCRKASLRKGVSLMVREKGVVTRGGRFGNGQKSKGCLCEGPFLKSLWSGIERSRVCEARGWEVAERKECRRGGRGGD